MRLNFIGFIIGYLLTFISISVDGQTIPDWELFGPEFNGLSTTDNSVGLNGVGRVISLVEDPSNSDIIYCGTEAGGLWKYSRSSNSSTLMNTDGLERIGIAVIAVHPTNSDIIYIGTGFNQGTASDFEEISRLSSSGIYKTIDGGMSWTLEVHWTDPIWYDDCIASLNKKRNYLQISKILISQSNPENVLVAFRSFDGWRCGSY